MNDPLKEEMIDLQMKFYQPYQNLLNDIEQYIVEEREDENDYYDEDETDIEDNPDLNLETTECQDIKDFIKNAKREIITETGLLEKHALSERIAVLNSQQRSIFDDVIERLASGDFEDNQFLIYIRYIETN